MPATCAARGIIHRRSEIVNAKVVQPPFLLFLAVTLNEGVEGRQFRVQFAESKVDVRVAVPAFCRCKTNII